MFRVVYICLEPGKSNECICCMSDITCSWNCIDYHCKTVSDLSGVFCDLFCLKLCLREDIRVCKLIGKLHQHLHMLSHVFIFFLRSPDLPPC